MTTQTLNGTQIFATGLESISNESAFQEAMKNVTDQAFTHLFEEQASGNLKWKRSGEDVRDFVTDISVKNAFGQEVTISAFLVAYIDGDGYRNAFLNLGSRKNAPCRNDADLRVKNLFTILTGQEWKVSF
jgi:hypothetical protein